MQKNPDVEVDDREGLPSASGFPRVMRCLASYLREKELKGIVDEGKACKKASKRGNVIHNAVHQSILERLQFSDRICAERLMFIEAQMVQLHNFEGSEIVREIRHWYFEDEQKVFSAKPDAIHLSRGRGMVINYKTGHYMPDMLPLNWQLLCEVALAAWTYKLTEVVGVLIHPNCDKLPGGTTHQYYSYNGERLRAVTLPKLVEASRDAMNPFLTGTPTWKGCEYCSAKKGGLCLENYQNPPRRPTNN